MGFDWLLVVQNRVEQWFFVSSVMTLLVLRKAGDFLLVELLSLCTSG